MSAAPGESGYARAYLDNHPVIAVTNEAAPGPRAPTRSQSC